MAVILHAAMENEICKKVLSARNYTTSCTQQHPQGITFSSKFLNRIDRKFGKGKVVGAKTGYVNQSRYCAVSMYESETNNKYICVTGMAGKAWQTVYDHIAFTKIIVNEVYALVIRGINKPCYRHSGENMAYYYVFIYLDTPSFTMRASCKTRDTLIWDFSAS